MYDGGKIITGLVIALALLTFPVWYNGCSTPPKPDPKLAPKAQEAGQCIYPKAYMKTSHMQVLDVWRNKVVRDGFRYLFVEKAPQKTAPEMIVVNEVRDQLDAAVLEVPGFGVVRDWVTVDEDTEKIRVAENVKMYEMSLQNTCMNCHTSKKEFCDQCHNYTNVSPFCWDCHVEPKEKE